MNVSIMAFTSGLRAIQISKGSTISLYKQFSPLLSTSILNEGIASPSCNTDNIAYSNYLNVWSVQSMKGVQQWFKLLNSISKHVSLATIFSHDIFNDLVNRNSSINMTEQLIPIIYKRGDVADIQMVTYNEYVSTKQITASQFVSHIGQIVLFGFPVDRETVSALRLESIISKYVIFRLKQGFYDGEFSRTKRNSNFYFTSSFDSPRKRNIRDEITTSSLISTLLTHSKRTNKKIIPNPVYLNKLVSHLRQVDSVGGSKNELKGLAKLRMFERVNANFNNYLINNSDEFDLYGLGRYEREVSPFLHRPNQLVNLQQQGQVDRRQNGLFNRGYSSSGQIPMGQMMGFLQPFSVRSPQSFISKTIPRDIISGGGGLQTIPEDLLLDELPRDYEQEIDAEEHDNVAPNVPNVPRNEFDRGGSTNPGTAFPTNPDDEYGGAGVFDDDDDDDDEKATGRASNYDRDVAASYERDVAASYKTADPNFDEKETVQVKPPTSTMPQRSTAASMKALFDADDATDPSILPVTRTNTEPSHQKQKKKKSN